MNDADTGQSALAAKIELIEEAYEFMLAYAAQGFRNESDSSGPGVRDYVSRAAGAIKEIAAAARPLLTGSNAAFLDLLARDAKDAAAGIDLVLSCRSISSQLVDNLNGSVHLRALLTDLFVLDEALKSDETVA